ncbi:MAG: 3-phosphoshikimate 1-carboxyvinyltransferase [Lachnospiraceae bacterium]|nr:3-phosphoshikimate 1-carboxyvinyltransferase [Lachnospiraceae bacterium]
MKAIIKETKLGGNIPAIASKSMAHRYMIAAALSDAPSYVSCHSTSEDIEATKACLEAMGAVFEKIEGGFMVIPVDFHKMSDGMSLPCKESGSTFRFLLPVAASFGKKAAFLQEGRLPQRPLSPLYEEMSAKGMIMSPQGSNPFGLEGKLEAGEYRLEGNVTSQFISGLLFALPRLNGDSKIILTSKLESKLYVDMTLAVLEQFGIEVKVEDNCYIIKGNQTYHAKDGNVEGDWSNAAFWLVAGAIGAKPVTVSGLLPDSLQGDRKIADILKEFGAKVTYEGNSITVAPGELKGIKIDAMDIPDLVPILAVVASVVAETPGMEGDTEIYNAARLRLKESDRLKTVTEVLNSLGADIEEKEDGLIIHGKGMLKGGTVNAMGDHRIAMMSAIAALRCNEEVIIDNAEAVNKSYPTFYEDYNKLGGKVEIR